MKVSPLWHQWLRHTREHPPTFEEQKREEFRQEQMKLLSAQADARWEAKPRLTDAPGQQTAQPLPAIDTAQTRPTAPDQEASNANAKTVHRPPLHEDESVNEVKKQYGKDPWTAAEGSSKGWQPKAWVPPAGNK